MSISRLLGAIGTLFFCLLPFGYATLRFAGQASTVNVGSGKLVVNSPLSGWNGTLRQQGSIVGAPITFDSGILETTQTPAYFSGVYDADASTPVTLSQNKLLRIDNGQFGKKIVAIREGNRLEGQPVFSITNAINLAHHLSQLTLALNSKINSSIVMNGGSIILDSDLQLADDRTLTGSGTVNVNGYRFGFGGSLGGSSLKATHTIRWNDASEIALNGPVSLSGTWTFAAVTPGDQPRILGNGNTLDLTQRGSIWIKHDTTLCLNDIKIKGLGAWWFCF